MLTHSSFPVAKKPAALQIPATTSGPAPLSAPLRSADLSSIWALDPVAAPRSATFVPDDDDIDAIFSRETPLHLSLGSSALDLANLPQTSPRAARLDLNSRVASLGSYDTRKSYEQAQVAYGDLQSGYFDPQLHHHPHPHIIPNQLQPQQHQHQQQQINRMGYPYQARMPSAKLDMSCRYFQNGYCSRGDACSFSHVLPLQPQYPQSINSQAASLLQSHHMHLGNSSTGGGSSSGSSSAGHLGVTNTHIPAKMPKTRFNTEDLLRFYNTPLEDLVGQLHLLCHDQHGCRYLQMKLEEKNETYLNMIFAEIFPHFVKLMVDPFGNYLCQRLMEYCRDEQREALVDAVAPHLVNISLNLHGTRAVQKMVDYLFATINNRNVADLIQRFCNALSIHVVTLIKDLNGNHVIQKCLNRLGPEHNQFIYDAVTDNCIQVATHRHGCCVLQRCIDHATEAQKIQLVTEITRNALSLVQDPFGNYVVQYVLDLEDPRFCTAITRKFFGNVCALSVQKFSSNVVEKGIRCADPDTRSRIISELLNRDKLETLLKDLYANYVIQTALECADLVQRNSLIECIKPILPSIRNTPFGKRIQSKIMRDAFKYSQNPQQAQQGNRNDALYQLMQPFGGLYVQH